MMERFYQHGYGSCEYGRDLYGYQNLGYANYHSGYQQQFNQSYSHYAYQPSGFTNSFSQLSPQYAYHSSMSSYATDNPRPYLSHPNAAYGHTSAPPNDPYICHFSSHEGNCEQRKELYNGPSHPIPMEMQHREAYALMECWGLQTTRFDGYGEEKRETKNAHKVFDEFPVTEILTISNNHNTCNMDEVQQIDLVANPKSEASSVKERLKEAEPLDEEMFPTSELLPESIEILRYDNDLDLHDESRSSSSSNTFDCCHQGTIYKDGEVYYFGREIIDEGLEENGDEKEESGLIVCPSPPDEIPTREIVVFVDKSTPNLEAAGKTMQQCCGNAYLTTEEVEKNDFEERNYLSTNEELEVGVVVLNNNDSIDLPNMLINSSIPASSEDGNGIIGTAATTFAEEVCGIGFVVDLSLNPEHALALQVPTEEELMRHEEPTEKVVKQENREKQSTYKDEGINANEKATNGIVGNEFLQMLNSPSNHESNEHDTDIVIGDSIKIEGGSIRESVLEFGDVVVEVLPISDDALLGSDNFDKRIDDLLATNCKKGEGITYVLKQIETILSRAKIEELWSDLLNRLHILVLNALKNLKVSFNDIQDVCSIGDSTGSSVVQELVKRLTGKDSNITTNSYKIVALLAAVAAGVLVGHVSDIFLLDVAPLFTGLENFGDFTPTIQENFKKKIFERWRKSLKVDQNLDVLWSLEHISKTTSLNEGNFKVFTGKLFRELHSWLAHLKEEIVVAEGDDSEMLIPKGQRCVTTVVDLREELVQQSRHSFHLLLFLFLIDLRLTLLTCKAYMGKCEKIRDYEGTLHGLESNLTTWNIASWNCIHYSCADMVLNLFHKMSSASYEMTLQLVACVYNFPAGGTYKAAKIFALSYKSMGEKYYVELQKIVAENLLLLVMKYSGNHANSSNVFAIAVKWEEVYLNQKCIGFKKRTRFNWKMLLFTDCKLDLKTMNFIVGDSSQFQWQQLDNAQAMWEDVKVLRAQFPSFFLEDKEVLNGGELIRFKMEELGATCGACTMSLQGCTMTLVRGID